MKFHWKPRLGAHSLVWEEAQLVNGADPDFHRRDLYDAIESGAFPQWELGVQVFPDTPEQTFEGIDLLDPTKIVPEEVAPVRPIGLLTLNAAPENFFAEVEQVAFHPGHLVPGIDVTDDPLLQARLFSYLDTQITRLGGPNFAQIPINRTHAPVNDMLRDGFHQDAVHRGVAPYRPNSLDAGCPFAAGEDTAFIDVPQEVAAGRKVRESPASFTDHHSQPRLFWRSMSSIEQEHLVAGYTFELGKCYEEAVKRRELESLALIDTDLCERVAEGLGLPVPPLRPDDTALPVEASPALSQLGRRWPVEGRIVAIVVDDGADLGAAARIQLELQEKGVLGLLVGPHGGTLRDGSDGVVLQRSYLTARSVEFDALLVGASGTPAPDAVPVRDAKAGAATSGQVDPRLALLIGECFRHCKPIGAWGAGQPVLEQVVPAPDRTGVVTGDRAGEVTDRLLELLAHHRVWDRVAS